MRVLRVSMVWSGYYRIRTVPIYVPNSFHTQILIVSDFSFTSIEMNIFVWTINQTLKSNNHKLIKTVSDR